MSVGMNTAQSQQQIGAYSVNGANDFKVGRFVVNPPEIIPYSFYDGESGFSSEIEKLVISSVNYLGRPRGCTVKWNGALYTSGRTSDIDTSIDIPVFIYGTFSDVSESSVVPIKNTDLAIIPYKIKKNAFFESEFEEYQRHTNVKIFENITVINMEDHRE